MLLFNLILHHLILHHLFLHFCLSTFGCCAFQKLLKMSWQSWDKSDWSHYGRKSSWESWEDSQGWSQSQSPRTVGPSEPILPQVTENEVAEIPESIPASQDTVIFSPSERPMLDRDEPSPVETPPNPKRKLTFTSPGNTQPTSGVTTSTQGTEASASTRLPAKRLRQATLTGKPTPAARQAGEIFNTPAQPSAWFTANYTGVHTESGIVRWFGGLKILGPPTKRRMRCVITLKQSCDNSPASARNKEAILTGTR